MTSKQNVHILVVGCCTSTNQGHGTQHLLSRRLDYHRSTSSRQELQATGDTQLSTTCRAVALKTPSSTYPIFIWSAPDNMDCAVHFASLAELFFSSVARIAPLCKKRNVNVVMRQNSQYTTTTCLLRTTSPPTTPQ